MDNIYFPPRELEVMSILWRLGSATVADVRTALQEDLAYTSVLSALQTLEEKGYVGHKAEGRGRVYRYHPLVKAERAGVSALARIKAAIFQGSAERMFAQMLAEHGLSRDELQRMRRLLAERLREES
jgi:predicted transcriptional regulator